MDNEQVTSEQTIETNTETESTTPVVDDNSDSVGEDLRKEINKYLEEPEATEEDKKDEEVKPTEEPKPEQKKDNSTSCPDKFKNEDGSVNVDNLLKSYKELEPLLQAKSEWQKEKAELLKAKESLDKMNQEREAQAQQAGFESAAEMTNSYEVASLEANEYAKYLQYTDDPETVREMLIQYQNNPTPELMEEIEMEFAPEVNKRVAIASDRYQQSFQAQQNQQHETMKMMSIENVIKASVEKEPELFNYEPFKQMFLGALQTYGDNFTQDDADALMNYVKTMKEAFVNEAETKAKTKQDNAKATDGLAALAPSSAQHEIKTDFDSMSESEQRREIRKYL